MCKPSPRRKMARPLDNEPRSRRRSRTRPTPKECDFKPPADDDEDDEDEEDSKPKKDGSKKKAAASTLAATQPIGMRAEADIESYWRVVQDRRMPGARRRIPHQTQGQRQYLASRTW